MFLNLYGMKDTFRVYAVFLVGSSTRLKIQYMTKNTPTNKVIKPLAMKIFVVSFLDGSILLGLIVRSSGNVVPCKVKPMPITIRIKPIARRITLLFLMLYLFT